MWKTPKLPGFEGPSRAKPILTALVGRNEDLFPKILALYVPPGSRIFDMTWGRGNFWRKVDHSAYWLVKNDLAPTAPDVLCEDFRHTSHPDASFDACVLDPPYACHGRGAPIKESIARSYNLRAAFTPRRAAELLTLYREGIGEARRLLRPNGVLIIKCQDQIDSNKQNFIHAALLDAPGFVCEDLFVLVQPTTPAMRHLYQKHARKNHSYFIVQRKLAR